MSLELMIRVNAVHMYLRTEDEHFLNLRNDFTDPLATEKKEWKKGGGKKAIQTILSKSLNLTLFFSLFECQKLSNTIRNSNGDEFGNSSHVLARNEKEIEISANVAP